MATEEELFANIDALLEEEPQLPPPVERARLREAAGITQARLATALKTTTQTVKNYENGRSEPKSPRLEAYQRLLQGWAAKYPAPVRDAAPTRDAAVVPVAVPQAEAPAAFTGPTAPEAVAPETGVPAAGVPETGALAAAALAAAAPEAVASAAAPPVQTAVRRAVHPVTHPATSSRQPHGEEGHRARPGPTLPARAARRSGRRRLRVRHRRHRPGLLGDHRPAAGGVDTARVRPRCPETQPLRQGQRPADRPHRRGRREARTARTPGGPRAAPLPAPAGRPPRGQASGTREVAAHPARFRPLGQGLPQGQGTRPAVRAAGDPVVGRPRRAVLARRERDGSRPTSPAFSASTPSGSSPHAAPPPCPVWS